MDKAYQLQKHSDAQVLGQQAYKEAYTQLDFKPSTSTEKSSQKKEVKGSTDKSPLKSLDFGDIWQEIKLTDKTNDSVNGVTKLNDDDPASSAQKSTKKESKRLSEKEGVKKESPKEKDPKVEKKEGGENGSKDSDLHSEIEGEGEKTKLGVQGDEPKAKTGAQVQEFTKLSLKLFDKIDKNRDGKITTKELATAIEDPTIKGVDAHILVTMYKRRRDLQRLSRSSSITRKGLQEFNAKLVKHDRDAIATDTMKKLIKDKSWMKKVDTNGDGYLMKAELKKSSRTKRLKLV